MKKGTLRQVQVSWRNWKVPKPNRQILLMFEM